MPRRRFFSKPLFVAISAVCYECSPIFTPSGMKDSNEGLTPLFFSDPLFTGAPAVFKPFISVSVVRTSLNLRQVFERANLWLFWRRLDHKLEQRTEEIEACNVDCVRKQKYWSWTLLLFRRIHLMIHGDLGIHICIRWSIQRQYDLYSVWIVLSNLERPSNSQLYAYEICKRIDKEIVIYVTFVPFSEDNVCAKQPWK